MTVASTEHSLGRVTPGTVSAVHPLLPAIARLALVAYLAVSSFPGGYQFPRAGIDPNWMYVFNLPSTSDVTVGRDFFYTWGPLTLLVFPMPLGNNVEIAAAFRIATQTLFFLCLAALAFRQSSLLAVVLSVAAFTLAQMLSLQYEYQLVILVGLLLLVASAYRRALVPAAAVAGALASTMLFVKTGNGLAALVMLGGWIGADVLMRAGGGWRGSVAALSGAAAALAILGALFLPSLADLRSWIAISREITTGYGEAMSAAWPWFVLPLETIVLGLALLIVGLCMVGPLSRVGLAAAALMLAGPVILTFKHGSVRQPAFFFGFVVAVYAILILLSRTWRERTVMVTAVLATLAMALPFGSLPNSHWLRRDTAIPFTVEGRRNIGQALDLSTTRDGLATAGQAALANQRLPDHWVHQMAQPGKTVDVTPWELTYVFANDLTWRPNPLLQTLVGWTVELDRVNARHFASARGPDFILMEWIELEGRHPLATAPETWRVILSHYDVVRVMGQIERSQLRLGTPFPLAMLERRATPREIQLVERDGGRAAQFEQIPVPLTDSMLFLNVDLERTISGRFMSLAAQIPAVSLRVFWEDGNSGAFRIVPDTLRNGLMVQPLTRGLEELRFAAERRVGARVTAVALEGPGLADFAPTFGYRWLSSTHSLADEPPTPARSEYQVDLAPAIPAEEWAPLETRTYSVTLTNRGTRAWFHTGPGAVKLSVDLTADSHERGAEQLFPLELDVLPGESVTLAVPVVAPAAAGSYLARHRLVAEGSFIFEQASQQPVTVK